MYSHSETFFDQDCINDNICMPVILKIIKKITANNIEIPNKTSSMPAWMNALLKAFTSYSSHINIKIFIAKLLINFSDPFTPYASSWYIPLVKFISNGEEFNDGFTYYIEVCIIININY